MVVPAILECDPGHDDAPAILLAAAGPRIDLLAITTVGGNQMLGLNATHQALVAPDLVAASARWARVRGPRP